MARNDEPGVRRTDGRRGGSGKWSKYRAGSGAGNSFQWDSVDSSVLLDALVAVSESGAALLLGKTRDGNCGVVTVCDGDERLKLYAVTTEEMEQELRGLSAYAKGD